LKLAVRMILSVILIAVALTMAVFTVLNFHRANVARESGSYVVGVRGGSVAVYAGDDLQTPLDVTDIELGSLRKADRELLTAGVTVQSREELLQLLEDLGG